MDSSMAELNTPFGDERIAVERQKDRARSRAQAAIQTGKLKRPKHCSNCGRTHYPIEAHHHRGYSDDVALDVIFLCRPCHTREHHPPTLKGYSKANPRLIRICWYCGESFQTACAHQR
jgi:hypothetical protein